MEAGDGEEVETRGSVTRPRASTSGTRPRSPCCAGVDVDSQDDAMGEVRAEPRASASPGDWFDVWPGDRSDDWLRDWSDHLRCPHLCATPICDVPVPQVALNLMEGMEDLQEDAPPASGDASSSTRKAQKAHADGGGKAQRGSAVARRLRMGPSGWDPTGLGLPDPPCCARNCPYLGCCV